MTHPIEKIAQKLSKRDQDIAERLREEAGFSDEDLYAALPNKAVDQLLKRKEKGQQP